MVKSKKVPISERALLQRINRKLAADNEVVKKTRLLSNGYPDHNLGYYYRLDCMKNNIIQFQVDLEDLGRELGCIQPWEKLEDF